MFFRECFISNHDMQNLRSFVKAAGKFHQNLFYARINDDYWSLFMLELSQEVLMNSDIKPKIMVTCVGKQPSSSVWVMGPDIQINEQGNLIPPEEREYYW